LNRRPKHGPAGQSTRERGRAGEDRAVDELLRHGLELLERNVTVAGAELDIVARDEQTIVFIEVRKRSEDRLGHPLETVDARKQARIRRGASGWLVKRGLWERVAVRFDVIAIVGDDVEWLRDAF
jgi:putative endonuclease